MAGCELSPSTGGEEGGKMEITQIDCTSPESAHAVHAYLLADLAQDEEAPDITAEVKDSALRVTYNFDAENIRQAWDWLLIGYRDGRESLDTTLKQLRHHLQHQPDVVRLIDSALGAPE